MNFLLTDHQDEGPVQIESRHSGSANGREANGREANSSVPVPTEMLHPTVIPRMEEPADLPGVRINGRFDGPGAAEEKAFPIR